MTEFDERRSDGEPNGQPRIRKLDPLTRWSEHHVTTYQLARTRRATQLEHVDKRGRGLTTMALTAHYIPGCSGGNPGRWWGCRSISSKRHNQSGYGHGWRHHRWKGTSCLQRQVCMGKSKHTEREENAGTHYDSDTLSSTWWIYSEVLTSYNSDPTPSYIHL